MSRARPTIVPARIVAGRTKLTESSDDVTTTPGAALVKIEQASGRSVTNAIVPDRNTPAPDCHHTLAGIAALAIPTPTCVRRIPVSFISGASGSLRSTLARIIARPERSSTSGPQNGPRGGSRSMSGTISVMNGSLCPDDDVHHDDQCEQDE